MEQKQSSTPYYRLIADSGSTKTDWVLLAGETQACQCRTQGINPFHQSAEEIAGVLRDELLPQLPPGVAVSEVAFYGSGLRPELQPQMRQLLEEAFPGAAVQAEGDLLGAARAVCGHAEGIACILGTGANSGLYDGRSIVMNTPPMGYILGDEGSGAVLGRLFLNLIFKDPTMADLRDAFLAEYQLTLADIIDRVYRQPLANRWLASLSPFVRRHLDREAVRRLVVDNFRQFFRRNLTAYGRPDLAVGFVGSVAFHFRRELEEAAEAEGFRVGMVLQCPLEGLAASSRTSAASSCRISSRTDGSCTT